MINLLITFYNLIFRSVTTPVAICEPNNWSSFALMSRQYVLLCYVRIVCLHHYTLYTRWQCFGFRHFVNKVSAQDVSADDKQEAAEFYFQHLPMHSHDVVWKIKSKSTFAVIFGLANVEMNLVGNYWRMKGLRTINPVGLPSTNVGGDNDVCSALREMFLVGFG